MTRRPGSPRRWTAVAAITTVGSLTLLAGPMTSDRPEPFSSARASALAPDATLCESNSSFCGAVLRVDSSTGSIPSVAAGAHYGGAWGIPTAPNDTAGTGWCVDDTHTGFPTGPIVELPLPRGWSPHDRRIAATIVALYGGDRVSPYQPLGIDATGELAGEAVVGASPTRLRHVAVWLALRSVLPDPAGTPRIDLPTATTFSDPAGRHPSVIGAAAVPLAREMVDAARRTTVRDGAPVLAVELGPDQLPTDTDELVYLPVRVTDSAGRPVAHAPVWSHGALNAEVTPSTSDDRDSRHVNTNAVLAGWPSFDTTVTRSGATVTNTNGVAFFSLRLLALGDWSVSFTAETSPTRLRLFGDDIRAQNNVTLHQGTTTSATATIEGHATQRHVRVVKTSTDPTRSVAGATFALLDADDTEVDRATTGDTGIVDFVVGSRHRTPLRVREIAAPPGLRALVDDIAVTLDDQPLSSDPDRPTIVAVENEPVSHPVSIEKRVVGALDEPVDHSGFVFTIDRRDLRTDDGTDTATVATGVDGRTPSVSLVPGDYTIVEIARPAWWPVGDPLPPPTEFSVPVDHDGPIVVAIDNPFPQPDVPTTTEPTTTSITTPPSPPSTNPPSTTASTTTSTTVTSSTTTPPPAPTTTTAAVPPNALPGPTGSPLPRTGAPWRLWYRLGAFILLAGATLYAASTIGLGSSSGSPGARRPRRERPGTTDENIASPRDFPLDGTTTH